MVSLMIVLKCDGRLFCEEEFEHESFADYYEDGVRDARAAAQREGWTSSIPGRRGTDRCPTCAARWPCSPPGSTGAG
jgi:hypothetical protein